MPTLDVINLEKKKVGTMELNAEVFGVAVNFPLVHQVIKAQLAGRRQGTAKTKVKSEVRGGGRKPFKQKGTGSARRGSQRSPLMVGGGQNFGPQPRSYEQSTPKEMMRGALRSALSDRVKAGKLVIVDSIDLKSIKTKSFAITLKETLGLDKVLIVDELNKNLELSGRNISRTRILRTEGINVYDIVKFENLMMTKRAIEQVQARLIPGATPVTDSPKAVAAPKAKKAATAAKAPAKAKAKAPAKAQSKAMKE